MSRILHRPMFRRGGQATGGITTGLGRQGYAEAGSVTPMDTIRSQMEMLDQLAPAPKTGLNDFLINFGLNMVGNPPSGNIFQTAAKEAQAPFGQFQQTRAREQLSRRDMIAQFIKGLSDTDKNAIEQEIQMRMTELGENRETAASQVLNKRIYGVLDEPGEAEGEALQGLIAQMTSPSNDYQVPAGVANIIAPTIMEIITQKNNPGGKGKYSEDIIENFDYQKYYVKPNQVTKPDPITNPELFTEDGIATEMVISSGNETSYVDGAIYFDYQKGKFYKKQGSTLTLVEDAETISTD
jgi:hypothetical protein